MRIFWAEMHGTLTPNMAIAFKNLGHRMLLADESFKDVIRYGLKWSKADALSRFQGNVDSVSVQELQDNPPDVLVITCWEVLHDMLRLIPAFPNAKIVYYAGNNGVPYPHELVKNLLVADVVTYEQFKSAPHNVFYLPYMDYENFPYVGPSAELNINSYIVNYKVHFTPGYNIIKELEAKTPYIKYNIFDGNVHRSELPNLMQHSMATAHLKHAEGYGYTILESLSSGRPVLLFTPYTIDRSYTKWCLPNKSALYFNTAEEYFGHVNRLLSDEDFRCELQESTAKTVREIVNNEEQGEILKRFLENLI